MKILKSHGEALGDLLRYSTLPEKYNELGEEFYVSSAQTFRNIEIKQLVIDCNPFIKGFSNEPPNVGSNVYYANQHMDVQNYILNTELRHGLTPTNKYPKIYYGYDKNNPDNYKDKIFIDNMAVSSIINNAYTNRQNYIQQVRELLINIGSNKEIFFIEHKFSKEYMNVSIDELKNEFNIKTYFVKDIFEQCDIIKNCYMFICLFSGGHYLVSAIKQNNLFPIVKVLDGIQHLQQFLTNRECMFDNLDYIPF